MSHRGCRQPLLRLRGPLQPSPTSDGPLSELEELPEAPGGRTTHLRSHKAAAVVFGLPPARLRVVSSDIDSVLAALWVLLLPPELYFLCRGVTSAWVGGGRGEPLPLPGLSLANAPCSLAAQCPGSPERGQGRSWALQGRSRLLGNSHGNPIPGEAPTGPWQPLFNI